MSSQLHHLEIERIDQNAVDFYTDHIVSQSSSGSFELTGFTQDLSACWMTRGPSFSLFDTKTGNQLWSLSFTSAGNSEVDNGYISTMCHYVDQDTNDSVFLVALHCPKSDTLYLVSNQEIVKSLKLPAMCVTMNCSRKRENLEQSSSFAFLGLKPAKVLIFWLNIHELAQRHAPCLDLEINESSSPNIQPEGLVDNILPCWSLEQCVSDGRSFKYSAPDGSVLKTFLKEVAVTSISYLEALGVDVLAVGFSVGCFYLFSLNGLGLMYSSQNVQELSLSSVRNFVFQVPPDDPRKCIYLWAGYSSNPSSYMSGLHHCQTAHDTTTALHYHEDFACVVLYQLNFDDTGDCLLRTCIPWFKLNLRSDILSQRDSSSIETYNRSAIMSMGTCSKTEGGSGSTGEGSSQVYMSWRFSNDASRLQENDEVGVAQTETQVGIFDLNCWYEAQMPKSVRVLTGQKFCPYFSVYNCINIVDNPNVSFHNFAVVPNSMRQFSFRDHPTPLFASFLCSYDFECCFLTELGIVNCETISLQQSVLENLEQVDISDASNVESLYKAAIVSKLIPVPQIASGDQDVNSRIGQLKQILALLGKYCKTWSMMRVCKMARKIEDHCDDINFFDLVQQIWSDFDVLSVNCSSFCSSLMNFDMPEIDRGFKRQFQNYLAQLLSYVSFFDRFCANYENEDGPIGPEEADAARKVLEHYQVVAWLLEKRYLPEMPPDTMDVESDKGFLYPADKIEMVYEKTIQLSNQRLNVNCLLFERLLEVLGVELQYPVKSFASALKTLFLNPKSEQPFAIRLALLNYIMTDVFAVLNSQQNEEEVVVMPVSQDENWIEVIKCLWRLDHGGDRLSAIARCNLEILPVEMVAEIVSRLHAWEQMQPAYVLFKKHEADQIEHFDPLMTISLFVYGREWRKVTEFVKNDQNLLRFLLQKIEYFQYVEKLIDLRCSEQFWEKFCEFIETEEGSRFAYIGALKDAVLPRNKSDFKPRRKHFENISELGNVAAICRMIHESQPEKEMRNPLANLQSQVKQQPERNSNGSRKEFLQPKVVTRNMNKKIITLDSIKILSAQQRSMEVTAVRSSAAKSRISLFESSPSLRVVAKSRKLDTSLNESKIRSPAAINVLSSAEINVSRASCDRSFTSSSIAGSRKSILKTDRSEVERCDSTGFLSRVLMNPNVDLSSTASSFSLFESESDQSFGVANKSGIPKDSPKVNVSFGDTISNTKSSKNRIYVDEEISIRKANISFSSNEDHNMTVPNAELILTDDEQLSGSGADVNVSRRVNCSSKVGSASILDDSFSFDAPGSVLFHSPKVVIDQPIEDSGPPETFQFSEPLPMNVAGSGEAVKFALKEKESNFPGHGDREIFAKTAFKASTKFDKSVVESESIVSFGVERNRQQSKSYWEFKPSCSVKSSATAETQPNFSLPLNEEGLNSIASKEAVNASKGLQGVRKSVRKSRTSRTPSKV